MSYQRVFPRDLFNESKLLKCLGRISLYIHDGFLNGLIMDDSECQHDILIDQNQNTGNLYVTNLHFSDRQGIPIYFSISYNSKENWPLLMGYRDEEYFILDEEGNLTMDKNISERVTA